MTCIAAVAGHVTKERGEGGSTVAYDYLRQCGYWLQRVLWFSFLPLLLLSE